MNDPDGHDMQSPAPQAIPGPRHTKFRLVVFSIRGHKYLVGNTTAHSIDEVLPGVGTQFHTITAVDRYVTRELAGLSCYHAVEIVDDDGRALMRGARSGFNSTGNTWIWRDIRPGDAPAPA